MLQNCTKENGIIPLFLHNLEIRCMLGGQLQIEVSLSTWKTSCCLMSGLQSPDEKCRVQKHAFPLQWIKSPFLYRPAWILIIPLLRMCNYCGRIRFWIHKKKKYGRCAKWFHVRTLTTDIE